MLIIDLSNCFNQGSDSSIDWLYCRKGIFYCITYIISIFNEWCCEYVQNISCNVSSQFRYAHKSFGKNTNNIRCKLNSTVTSQ